MLGYKKVMVKGINGKHFELSILEPLEKVSEKNHSKNHSKKKLDSFVLKNKNPKSQKLEKISLKNIAPKPECIEFYHKNNLFNVNKNIDSEVYKEFFELLKEDLQKGCSQAAIFNTIQSSHLKENFFKQSIYIMGLYSLSHLLKNKNDIEKIFNDITAMNFSSMDNFLKKNTSNFKALYLYSVFHPEENITLEKTSIDFDNLTFTEWQENLKFKLKLSNEKGRTKNNDNLCKHYFKIQTTHLALAKGISDYLIGQGYPLQTKNYTPWAKSFAECQDLHFDTPLKNFQNTNEVDIGLAQLDKWFNSDSNSTDWLASRKIYLNGIGVDYDYHGHQVSAIAQSNGNIFPINGFQLTINRKNDLDLLEQAVNTKAKIISISFNLVAKENHQEGIEKLKTIIKNNPNIIFINAAGNRNIDIDIAGNSLFDTLSPKEFPNLIHVGALDNKTTLGNYSNYDDLGDVEFAARSIWYAPHCKNNKVAKVSLFVDPNNNVGQSDYTYFSGTSAAAPYVANICRSIFMTCPSLTPEQVKTILSLAATKNPNFVNKIHKGQSLYSIDQFQKCIELAQTCQKFLLQDPPQLIKETLKLLRKK